MHYVVHAPRVNLLSANKEGLISLTGEFSCSGMEPMSKPSTLQKSCRVSVNSPHRPIDRNNLAASFSFILPPFAARDAGQLPVSIGRQRT